MKYELLKKLNILLDNSHEDLFENFEKIILLQNKNINLISHNDEDNLFYKHIYDSLAINLFFSKYTKANNLLDIGTGGGFPSLPLAIYYKEMNILAIDSIRKKINTINSIITELKLNNIKTMAERVENLHSDLKEAFEIVTTRAMADLRIILEYGVPFVKNGGYFIAYKSIKADEELINAQNAIKLLDVALVDKIEYELPLEEKQKRVLLIFKKLKSTNPKYPRKNGVIKKNPL